MTTEQIEKFISPEHISKKPVRISFKTRNNVVGLFLDVADFNDLKAKNFWRVVLESNIEDWKKSQNMSLARIFNGAEFTRLAPFNEK
ncbi:hypothetical protein SAMN05421788_1011038 [Filimonas lacunae]|uniref:Uncharacterized protein n=1 Tax=Filimonas lacunae TaxID=477680 RepID=A0A173MPM7_9BACT|nr:short-chain dehydrogenase [Filimonas lacunae]BAV09602.1 hypothetical protein FLA_5653 [Filimonas lacunae]SIS75797.1 hypothetical protein SAMN05421788_1011038 [Filimonas lacunae]